MKYIIVLKDDIESAISFPENIQHCEAINPDKVYRRGCVLGDLGFPVIVAAGFYHLHHDGSINVWGESDSLSIGNRGQADAEAIRFSLGLPLVSSPVVHSDSTVFA